jgi:hypothetical protein
MTLHGVAAASAQGGLGLKVVMEPIPGITKPGLMPLNGIFLQTPPTDSFDRDYGYSHTDYQTARAGQFSQPGGRNLRTTSFDTLVLDYAAWAFYNDQPYEELVTKLIQICEGGSAFLLTASHDIPSGGYGNWSLALAGPEIQWPATLRSLRVSEKAGEPDSRYLTMSFTEYRDPNTSARSVQGLTSRPSTIKLPTTVLLYADGHAVDDTGKPLGNPPAHPVTLAMIAQRWYGDAAQWRAIAARNGFRNTGANDALITSVVPASQRNAAKPTKVVKKIIVPKTSGSHAAGGITGNGSLVGNTLTSYGGTVSVLTP